jgi:3-phenylpropionate/cinnamic acid dioxygenase small subunit
MANPADVTLQHEIEQFLYYEAAILDARCYTEWLDLLSEDCSYYMPTRYNRTRREMEHEFSHENEVAHFDDDKASLRVRVKRLFGQKRCQTGRRARAHGHSSASTVRV